MMAALYSFPPFLKPSNQGAVLNAYQIRSARGVGMYDNAAQFLAEVDRLLEQGIHFVIQVLRGAVHVLERVKHLLKKHGVSVVIDPRSQPEAADYVVNIFAGAVVGGVGFGAAGALTWAGLRTIGLAIPAAAPFIAVASLVGMTAGALGGVAATRWGLRVRFSPADYSQQIVMEFQRK
jgi:hypothetical protein